MKKIIILISILCSCCMRIEPSGYEYIPSETKVDLEIEILTYYKDKLIFNKVIHLEKSLKETEEELIDDEIEYVNEELDEEVIETEIFELNGFGSSYGDSCTGNSGSEFTNYLGENKVEYSIRSTWLDINLTVKGALIFDVLNLIKSVSTKNPNIKFVIKKL